MAAPRRLLEIVLDERIISLEDVSNLECEAEDLCTDVLSPHTLRKHGRISMMATMGSAA